VKLFLLAAAAACALAAGAARAAPGPSPYTYDRLLAAVARETLWQAGIEDSRLSRGDVLPVGVRCYRSRAGFETMFEQRFGRSAHRIVAYYAGGRDINLRHGTCANVRALLRGQLTVLTAGAYAVLLHETLHRQGLAGERVTTCFADESVRWGLRWFGFSDAQALRGRNLAFTYTRLYAPPSYRMGRPNCLILTRRAGWFAFTR
jgi:hypothetical protein